MVCGAWTEGGAFCGAAIASDWGLSLVKARVIVDTTSDADAAVFAGAKYDFGDPRDGSVMTNGQWGDSATALSDFTLSCWKRDFDMIDNDDYAFCDLVVNTERFSAAEEVALIEAAARLKLARRG